MIYEPEYSEREILVGYKNMVEPRENFPEHFVSIFFIGVKYVGSWKYGEDVYIYKVPAGLEEITCEKLLEKKDFVDWTGRRDLKLEGFWDLTKKMRNIIQDIDPRDPDVNEKLELLINNSKNLQNS
ncbi:hypothetical protein HN865_00855 [Candidatus Woesearchaeota archaeon]|jgi:hypothetical protein|nr:hypothetical protein [Candidatus Woesearchaeota archaeon]MBT7237386.1 hypothetical protein [Candidatus Woesearchaeota archaeon]